jgi:anaerobic magnesium-protoporphyrin IX monomethyl ester cyclase
MVTKVLFVEPPKDYWFLMGEYLPRPIGLLALAAYLEKELEDVDLEILDCQAESLDWGGLQKRISSSTPDIVASLKVVESCLGRMRRLQPDAHITDFRMKR